MGHRQQADHGKAEMEHMWGAAGSIKSVHLYQSPQSTPLSRHTVFKDPLLSNLVFTKSTGRLHGEYDTTFNDATQHGKFPVALKIKGIKSIEVYSNGENENAYISGLKIQYDGVAETVIHGIVTGEQVGKVEIQSKHLLVGTYGRLKAGQGTYNGDLISSIGFVLFDKTFATVVDKGPFSGTTELQTSPWASFGPIIAFHGTQKDGVGITSLGFVRSSGPFQDIQIVQNPAVGHLAGIQTVLNPAVSSFADISIDQNPAVSHFVDIL